MTNHCTARLLECISDYFSHASYCWWPMSVITNPLFSRCLYSFIIPPLDGMHEWKSEISRNTTPFISIMNFGLYNKLANQQSIWPILSTFWKELGQYHASPPPERKPFDTQMLDNVEEKQRGDTLTMLSRDFSNRQ